MQQILEVSPNEVTFNNVTVGQTAEQVVLIHGYRETGLNVREVEFLNSETAKFFEAQIEPLSAEEVAARTGAHSGSRIRLHLKPGLPIGHFSQQARLLLNDSQLDPVELPIQGAVTGNFDLVGQDFDRESGVWRLGKLNELATQRRTLWIFARGPAASLELRVASVDPSDVLQVTVEKPILVGHLTKHAIQLTIRPDGRVVNRLGSSQGPLAEIRIETNDPQASQIRIPVSFALAGS